MSTPAPYRYRDLKPGDPYYKAWREYRLIHHFSEKGALLLAVGIAVFAVLAQAGGGRHRLRAGSWAPAIIVVMWAAGILIAVGFVLVGMGRLKLSDWGCPRCGTRNPKSRDADVACGECGLGLWESS